MTVNELINQKKITKYRLSKDSVAPSRGLGDVYKRQSKDSGVPYTTVNDICSGKAQLEKCSAETVYRISKALGVTMESLIESCFDKRSDFELFKSNTCHMLKELGDIPFIIELLEKDEIRKDYQKGWYRESLYLLAMLDYVSRENQVPICTQYDDLRRLKLRDTVYPASVLAMSEVTNNPQIKEQSIKEAIPEFIRFNIVESEVRNVI